MGSATGISPSASANLPAEHRCTSAPPVVSRYLQSIFFVCAWARPGTEPG
jgi:hypothetical protein